MKRVAVLVVLVLLSGCGSGVNPGAIGGEETPSVTPVAVPTDAPVDYPTGLSEEDVNATALAQSHATRLGETQHVWTFDHREARPEPGLGTVYVGPHVTAETATPTRYTLVRERVTERGGGLSVRTAERARFAFGNRVLVRDENGTESRNLTADDRGLTTQFATGYVERYLAVENVTVERLENGSFAVDGRDSRMINATAYELTALVGPRGFVERFEVVYAQNSRVRFVTYSATLQPQAVTPPPWVANRTVSGYQSLPRMPGSVIFRGSSTSSASSSVR